MIKNYNGVLVSIDNNGKEEILARTNNKDLAKEAAKSLNIAQKIKSDRKSILSDPYLMPDKHGGKFQMDKQRKKFY